MHHSITTTMAALGDPTRFAIVERLLKNGETSAGDLAEPFSMSKPAISRHLKVLENAQLIRRHTRAQFRVFSARPDTLRKMDDWLREYRKFWEVSFDRLDEMLNEIPAQIPGEKTDKREAGNNGDDQ